MTKRGLIELYEKQYFYELDRIDKGNTEFQHLFVMLVAQYSSLVFLLDRLSKLSFDLSVVPIDFLAAAIFLSTLISTGLASWQFKKAWRGDFYSFLPVPKETENYLQSLRKLYQPYKEKESLIEMGMKRYTRKYFIDCTVTNTDINDRRAIYRNHVNKYLMLSFFQSITCAFMIYYPMFKDILSRFIKQV